MRDALADVAAVVHLAARVHVLRDTARDPLAEFRRVNVGITQNVLAGARATGVRKFIYVSSVKAVGESTSAHRPWSDDVVPHPSDPYGVSKLEAERLVATASDLMDIISLRPPLVYGPGNSANALALFRIIVRGLPVPVSTAVNRRSIIFVGNLAAAIAAAVNGKRGSERPYFVRDADLSTAEMVTMIARESGRRPRLVRVPSRILDATARVTRPLGNPGSRLSNMIDRVAGSLVVDDSRFRTDFDFQPPVNTSEAFKATAQWVAQTR